MPVWAVWRCTFFWCLLRSVWFAVLRTPSFTHTLSSSFWVHFCSVINNPRLAVTTRCLALSRTSRPTPHIPGSILHRRMDSVILCLPPIFRSREEKVSLIALNRSLPFGRLVGAYWEGGASQLSKLMPFELSVSGGFHTSPAALLSVELSGACVRYAKRGVLQAGGKSVAMTARAKHDREHHPTGHVEVRPDGLEAVTLEETHVGVEVVEHGSVPGHLKQLYGRGERRTGQLLVSRLAKR